MSKFLVSVGDSDKYAVNFDGDKKQFENSDFMASLKAKVADFLKSKFPMGGFKSVVPFDVVEDDGAKNYLPLDEQHIPELLKSAARQVEVLLRNKMQNLNAPFDKD